MTRPAWLRDSITFRFLVAILAATVFCAFFNVMVDFVYGPPALPPRAQSMLLDQLSTIVAEMNALPREQREALARTASTQGLRVDWHRELPGASGGDQSLAGGKPPTRRSVAAPLRDASWVVFTPLAGKTNPDLRTQIPLRLGALLLPILFVSLFGASRLARPINSFAIAARRFGADPNAAPMIQQGPAEIQEAITAFNAMQSQIQRFVSGQAVMFAAISHDLRTPLTRMRLRGEFIDDPHQQERLFRDVDEMQTMIQAALLFLRDNVADEATTILDLAELLRTIADDHADMGNEVVYSGPPHLAFPGRPVALKRAFGNVVDNAVKYGVHPRIDLLGRPAEIQVTIADDGPGIPADVLEAVFTPFQRVETSRNRTTGGMGLGLTSARAVFRAHGGEITLSNAARGGLRATIVLPLATDNRPLQQREPADAGS